MRQKLLQMTGALGLLLALGTAAFLLGRNEGQASGPFIVNSTDDTDDADFGGVFDGVCDDGTGQCTLRAAIEEANASVGVADTINFAISTVPKTIAPGSSLPIITDPVTIDGTTQSCCVELDGLNAGYPTTGVGLKITAGGSTVRGLIIVRFGDYGIELGTLGGNVIQGNYIGTDAAGAADLGNGSTGIMVYGSPSNTIGGAGAGEGNVISGNGSDGIYIGAHPAPLGGTRWWVTA